MINELKTLWKETEEFVEQQEKQIAEKYIHFLREVAIHYISKGKRVLFRENRVVHYGEGGFGWMIIESDDDPYEIFGEYVPEIQFESEIRQSDIAGYIEINEDNIKEINY